jgi:hypothetical protein
MADIIPPGYVEVLIPFRHALLARDALVTFAYESSDATTVADANNLLERWRLFVQSSLDNQVTCGPATLRVGQDGGENLVVVGTGTFVGTVAATDSLNGGQAVLFHKRTARGGRRGRGRFYIPWIVQDNVVGETGVIAPATVTAFNTAITSWLNDTNALAFVDNVVLLHSPSQPGTVNPTPPGDPNVITSMFCDPIVGSQRRRLGRR